MKTRPALQRPVLTGVVLAAALLAAPAGARGGEEAIEPPSRSLIEQQGEAIPYYTMGGRLYREVEGEELLRLKPGILVAFVAKLDSVTDGRAYFLGQPYQTLRFQLPAGVTLPTTRRGANLLVGALRLPDEDDGPPGFRIQTAARMPGDLVIYKRRRQALAEAGTTEPGAYFALGDWVEMAKDLSQIPDDETFKAYTEARDAMYRRALELELRRLKPTPAAARERLTAARDFVRAMGEAPPGKAAALLVTAERELLEASTPAVQALKQGQLPAAEEARRVAARAYLNAAELYRDLLDDAETASATELKAARLAPELPAVTALMEKRDYVLHEGTWMSKQEKAAAERRARAEAEAVARAEAEAARAAEAAAGAERLAVGENFETKRLTADLLVGLDAGAGLAELQQELAEMPEDVARRALFAATAWHADRPEKRLALLAATLEAASPVLRRDAARLLAATGAPEARQILLAGLDAAEEEALQVELVDALWRLPESGGVAAMVEVVSRGGLPAPVRGRAVEYLKQESGEDHGLDAFAWKRWWAHVKGGYERKPLPGAIPDA